MSRSYDNSSRARSVRETRRRILASAHELIVSGGYRSFSIVALAKAAGVSPQTVYNAVGGKSEVLKACYDVALAGDDEPVPMSDRPAFKALAEVTTPGEWAAAYAGWTRHVHEHVGDLVGATLFPGSSLDGGAGTFAATLDRERRIGTTHAMEAFAERFGLPDGCTLQSLVDAIWVLNAPEVYDRLVRQSGWDLEGYEEWIATQLRAALRIGDERETLDTHREGRKDRRESR